MAGKRMADVLIVKAGGTFVELAAERGDFDDWVRDGLDLPDGACRTVSPYRGEGLPAPDVARAVVVTGSHAMVSGGEGWSRRTAAWLGRVVAANVPLLAICYGHQLLAEAMGGKVGANPNGREFGTVEVRLQPAAAEDRLLGEASGAFPAHVCHTESVLSLPSGAVRLAASDGDPHQAFRIGAAAWGVQFHPEFDAPAVRFYIEHFADDLRADGLDPDRMLASVTDAPAGPELLRRFGRMVRGDGERGQSSSQPEQ